MDSGSDHGGGGGQARADESDPRVRQLASRASALRCLAVAQLVFAVIHIGVGFGNGFWLSYLLVVAGVAIAGMFSSRAAARQGRCCCSQATLLICEVVCAALLFLEMGLCILVAVLVHSKWNVINTDELIDHIDDSGAREATRTVVSTWQKIVFWYMVASAAFLLLFCLLAAAIAVLLYMYRNLDRRTPLTHRQAEACRPLEVPIPAGIIVVGHGGASPQGGGYGGGGYGSQSTGQSYGGGPPHQNPQYNPHSAPYGQPVGQAAPHQPQPQPCAPAPAPPFPHYVGSPASNGVASHRI